MEVFVLPDIHGHAPLMEELLQTAGVVGESGDRLSDAHVVQIGDLCNCTKEDVVGDLNCLTLAERWIDTYLVGNHEYPYFEPRESYGFFFFHGEVRDRMLALQEKIDVRPAVSIDGVLLTHAGLTECWESPETAAEASERINYLWGRDTREPIFSHDFGILWARAFSGMSTPGYILQRQFSQVVGHTPAESVRHRSRRDGTFGICIDLGGTKYTDMPEIAGLWLRDGVPEVVKIEIPERARGYIRES